MRVSSVTPPNTIRLGLAMNGTADKMHVTAQAVQLGDDYRTLAPLGLVQRGGKLRPTRQRVVPLAGLDLGKFDRVTKPSRLANCSFVARCPY